MSRVRWGSIFCCPRLRQLTLLDRFPFFALDFEDVLAVEVLCVELVGFFGAVPVRAETSVPAISSEHPSIIILPARPKPTGHLKASSRDGTEIIPRLRLQCQSRKCVVRLRKCSR